MTSKLTVKRKIALAVDHLLDLGLVLRQLDLRRIGRFELAIGECFLARVVDLLLKDFGHDRLAVDLRRCGTGTLPGRKPLMRTLPLSSPSLAEKSRSSSDASTITLNARLRPSFSVSVICMA